MRKGVLIFILPILVLVQVATALAQSSDKPAAYYFNLYSGSSVRSSSSGSNFLKFSQKLAKRKGQKNDRQFLKYVFSKTHQRYLRTYSNYATFNAINERGVYNCLTGTALYALLLKDLGYDFKIIETNYHIFLVVNTDAEGKILFEATDPVKGFIADERAVEKRIARYREDQFVTADAGKNYYLYSFKLFNEVNLDQMLGLLYYNEAIQAFNDHQLQAAVVDLDNATTLYNSPRISEFSKIILLCVMQSKLDHAVKENCVRKIQSIRKQQIPSIGSASLSD
jgi:hypothetical protein